MSALTVKQAFADWLAPPAVAGLNTVLRHPLDRSNPGTAYGTAQGAGSGMWAGVHVGRKFEQRIALGGPTSGEKKLTYQVDLDLRFWSVKPDSLEAQDDYWATVAAIEDRLRADRTLGTSGSASPVWQIGEGDASGSGGAPDIEVITDLPRQGNNGALSIWGLVRVTAVEMIVH